MNQRWNATVLITIHNGPHTWHTESMILGYLVIRPDLDYLHYCWLCQSEQKEEDKDSSIDGLYCLLVWWSKSNSKAGKLLWWWAQSLHLSAMPLSPSQILCQLSYRFVPSAWACREEIQTNHGNNFPVECVTNQGQQSAPIRRYKWW